MIWLTWAPESENVTSARGCFMIASRCSGSRLAMTCTKNCSKFGLERQVDHHARPGPCPSSAARSATVGFGRHGLFEDADPVVVGLAGLGADGRGRSRRRGRPARAGPAAPGRGRRGPARRAAGPAPPATRAARRTGSRVFHDSSTENSRAWAWAHIWPPGRGGRVDELELAPPVVAVAGRGQHAERERHAGARRPGRAGGRRTRPAPPGSLERAAGSWAISNMPVPTSPMHADQRRDLVPVARREATGRSSEVSWFGGAAGGEADGAGPQRVAQLAGHDGQVVVATASSSKARSPMAHVRRAEWPMWAA